MRRWEALQLLKRSLFMCLRIVAVSSAWGQVPNLSGVSADTIFSVHDDYDDSIVVDAPSAIHAGETARLVFRCGGKELGQIRRLGCAALKVESQTSTGVCGTDFDHVIQILDWDWDDEDDKTVEIPTYWTGAGKTLRVKLTPLTIGEKCQDYWYYSPSLDASKIYIDMLPPDCGTIVVTEPDPRAVEAGETLRMTFARQGGSAGAIAVKAKTQSSTAVMGVNGSADFDYVNAILEWGDDDTSDRHIDIPTYANAWEGSKMLRVKLATLATGAHAGNLVPTLAESKVYVEIASPYSFGIVSVAPEKDKPVAGEMLRLVFRRTGGRHFPVAVKYKVQTSTAIAGEDFEYQKDVIVWPAGEDGDIVVNVPTYPSAAGKTLRVKLSTLTQGDYAGHVAPRIENAKVYVRMAEP